MPSRFLELRWAVTGTLCLLLALLLGATAADQDLWGHTRYGLDMLQTHTLPVIDPYSFTQDRPWVNHEWLSELALAGAYRAGGVPGLVGFKAVLVMAAFALLAFAWRSAHPVIAGATLLVAAWAALPVTMTVRPQLWTLLGLLLLGHVLQGQLTIRRLGAIALIFAVWVNLHGGWLLGIATLGVWSIVTATMEWRETHQLPWRWLALPPTALAATIVNPYGIGMWQFLLDTVTPAREVTEWQPLLAGPAITWIGFLLAAIFIVGWRLFPSWPASAAMLLLAYGGIRVARIAPLAVPFALLLIAPVAAKRWPASGWHARAPSRLAAALAAIPVLTVAWSVAPFLAAPYSCLPLADQEPVALARLRDTRTEGRLAVWPKWGQYALWHLSPRLRVSNDGRRETVYSEGTRVVQRAVATGTAPGDAWLVEVRPEYVWLPARYTARRDWLLAHGYRLDHSDAASYIATRGDLPPLPAGTPAACFPG